MFIQNSLVLIEKKTIPKKYKEDRTINFFNLEQKILLTLDTKNDKILKNSENWLLKFVKIIIGINFIRVKNKNIVSQDSLFLKFINHLWKGIAPILNKTINHNKNLSE